MSKTTAAIKPGDKVCWVKVSPRSARTMSLRRSEGVLVASFDNGFSDVKMRNGKVTTLATDRISPIASDPLREFTHDMLEHAQGRN